MSIQPYQPSNQLGNLISLANGAREAYNNYHQIVEAGRNMRNLWDRADPDYRSRSRSRSRAPPRERSRSRPRSQSRSRSRSVAPRRPGTLSTYPSFAHRGVGGKRVTRPRTSFKKRFQKRKRVKFARKVYAIANPSRQVGSVRSLASGVTSSSSNKPGYTQFSLCTNTDIEAKIVLARAQHKNLTDGTIDMFNQELDDVDISSVRVLSAWDSYQFKNNSTFPVNLQATWYICKMTTVQLPVNLWALDMVDRDGGTATETPAYSESPLHNIREQCKLPRGTLSKFYKVYKQRSYRITGGDSCTLKIRRKKPFDYSALMQDNQGGLDNIRGVTMVLVLRQIGDIAHSEAILTNIGYAQSTLDYIKTSRWEFDLGRHNRKYKSYTTDATTFLPTLVTPTMAVDDMKVDVEDS